MKKQKIPKEKEFITVLDVIRDMGLEPTEELAIAVDKKMRDYYERITGHPPGDGLTIDELRALWERRN